MKVRIIAMVMMLVVLGSLVAGCGSSGGGQLVGIMKVLPYDVAEVTYVDIKAIAEDPDLEDMYGSLQDSFGELQEEVGIDFSDLHAMAYGYGEAGILVILKGKFDIDEFRSALKDTDTEEDEYRGLEIWTKDNTTLAFLEEMLIFGDMDTVKVSIRVSQGEETSMYDDEDVKAVIDKLPAGIMIFLQGEEALYNIDGLVGGVSIRKSADGEGTLEIKGWYKFRSETSAEAALADLEDYLKDYFDATDMNGQLKGEFIEITGKTDIPSID